MGDQRVTYGTKIREKLGEGSFGAVYKVDCPSHEEFAEQHPIVAIKEINQVSLLTRLLNRLVETKELCMSNLP